VVFKHCYLTAPEVTPEDRLIHTLNNVKAAVTKHKSVHHKNVLEHFTNLSNLWALLNDKKVRFDDRAKPPRVETVTPTPGNQNNLDVTTMEPQ
jgi:hypothetical protein